jgi:hypothetical protein
VTAPGGGSGGSPGRRSGRRSAEPLQRISLGPASDETREDEPLDEGPGEHQAPADTPGARGGSKRRARSTGGLDRIRPRSAVGPPGAEPSVSRASATRGHPEARVAPDDLGDVDSSERDPLGRAALYSSGERQAPPALGTFLVECSACHRETPVTAGDLIRLGVPSFHLPLVKRYPSLMRCPACGRRTWVRVRWRL